MPTPRRWLISAIAAAAAPQPALPWQRSARRRPEALKAEPAKPTAKSAAKTAALAAH